MKARIGLGLMVLGMLAAGCSRKPEPQYVTSAALQKLDEPLRKPVTDVVLKECGTYASPKMFREPGFSTETLKLGQAVYTQRCQQCHGTTGDGAGPVAEHMRPRPRDYRPGVFKFTTTPYGAKPQKSDLIRTVTNGIPGTSMPSFRLLPKKEMDAVVDYVLSLTHRGELENMLIQSVDAEGEVNEDIVNDSIETVLSRWQGMKAQEVQPKTPEPDFTRDMVVAGKQAFLSKGCSKCHGEDGRGQTAENIGVDSWGHPTRAADLTSGMLHGGSRPVDIYRRIVSGINGTPMPGFALALAEEPDTIWNLTSYVLYLSNERRRGKIPLAGTPMPFDAAAKTLQPEAAE
ncbi:MAG TPA: c-type cytochrome [Planctomycetaceae bacterium]|nr:c-type cytochrome [Planctomycetaceae bacterium]